LSQDLGVSFMVENVPGAGGNIAARRVSEAAPDGYTLLAMSTVHTINPALYEDVPYDPVTSFQPIGMMGGGALLLLTHPSSGLKTIADVKARALEKPGALSYASGGSGTTSHLLMENFEQIENLDILHVP